MTPPTPIIDNIVNKTMMDDTLRIVINFNRVNSNNKNINNNTNWRKAAHFKNEQLFLFKFHIP